LRTTSSHGRHRGEEADGNSDTTCALFNVQQWLTAVRDMRAG
jgi:hypothetical protein